MSLDYTYCLGAIAKVLRSGVMAKGKLVTPTQIDAAAGTGNYASKYVGLMRKFYGFTITETKDGRTVVSYCVTGEPENLAELTAFEGVRDRSKKPAKAVQPAPKPAPIKLAITEEKRRIKAAEAKPKAKPKAKKVKDKPVFDAGRDMVENTFGSTGEVASSYSIDPDWDAWTPADEASIPAFLRV